MTVVFDAEPLLAFAFDEPGAEPVERRLNRVYDGDTTGYVTSVNLAEVRYVAARRVTRQAADTHVDTLLGGGLRIYQVDGLWRTVSAIKQSHAVALGDAYAVAAAEQIADSEGSTTLLVGADDDYDSLAKTPQFNFITERFREKPG